MTCRDCGQPVSPEALAAAVPLLVAGSRTIGLEGSGVRVDVVEGAFAALFSVGQLRELAGERLADEFRDGDAAAERLFAEPVVPGVRNKDVDCLTVFLGRGAAGHVSLL
jgi:hypothetical protein